MNYSLSKIKQLIKVDSLEELSLILSNIPSSFYNQKFQKSKSVYLENMKRLFNQINQDFHFVYLLKQEKYAFQLRWKESVLEAHIDLLISEIPSELCVKKAI
ncbi:MAG: hypothetical protein CMP67_05235 [Flavobacteriales bacterium]|nr:hypothetical protein [Flavobacteriales bacterium]|tara:strand:- start:9315 stop:9620 length:306 start_codon:yes stop_codon:yes gene_type:complete